MRSCWTQLSVGREQVMAMLTQPHLICHHLTCCHSPHCYLTHCCLYHSCCMPYHPAILPLLLMPLRLAPLLLGLGPIYKKPCSRSGLVCRASLTPLVYEHHRIIEKQHWKGPPGGWTRWPLSETEFSLVYKPQTHQWAMEGIILALWDCYCHQQCDSISSSLYLLISWTACILQSLCSSHICYPNNNFNFSILLPGLFASVYKYLSCFLLIIPNCLCFISWQTQTKLFRHGIHLWRPV